MTAAEHGNMVIDEQFNNSCFRLAESAQCPRVAPARPKVMSAISTLACPSLMAMNQNCHILALHLPCI